MDTNTPVPSLPGPLATSGGDFALGMALGRIETRLAAIETAGAAASAATATGLTEIRARLDDIETSRDAFRQALNLLAANAGKSLEWVDDETSGDEKLALVDAPGSPPGRDPGTGGGVKGASAKAVNPNDTNPRDKASGRTGMFDAYRRVTPPDQDGRRLRRRVLI